ncbi:MAG TPA: SCO family protein [Rhodospirillales bacterium]|nr:SCO family protein [Rhodospirillales bacterium]
MAKPTKDKSDKKDPGARSGTGPEKTFLRRGTLIGFLLVLLIAVVVGQRYLPTIMGKTPLPSSSQAVPIGGPFSLVDHLGRSVNQNSYTGRFLLVFFGYTFCPDVCPATLTEIGYVLDMLGAKGEMVTPLFITVDLERDTPEYLKEYLSHFHPRIVGLTGTLDQVKSVVKAYKIYVAKAPTEQAHEHKSEAAANEPHDHDYDMEHQAFIFLMGTDGAYRAQFPGNADAKTMAAKIKDFL